MSLYDGDVDKQIEQMIAFIQQEGAEKVEEIEVKAEEEFHIEKSRLVAQQRVKIIEFYDKKEKQIEVQRKIQRSNLVNSNRLMILQAREDYLRTLKEEAKQQLADLTRDRSKYITLLANLILQGLLVLSEEHVTIRCRHDDYGLVQRLLPDALQQYQRAIRGGGITVIVDKQNFLADDLAGGVELYAKDGKIKVSNTVEDRLELLFDQMRPEIREKLFGVNLNRKYHDHQ